MTDQPAPVRIEVIHSGNRISIRSTERPRELSILLDPREGKGRNVIVTPCEAGGIEHRCSKATPAELVAWLVNGVDLPPHGHDLLCRDPQRGKA